MDKANWGKIRTAFTHVLEKQAFLFPEAMAPEDFHPGEWPYLAGVIAFKGRYWGKILLAMPVEMSREVGANVLGLEPDDPSVAEHCVDAMKEILNVVCGHVLTALHGTGTVFDLSVPQVEEITSNDVGLMSQEPESIAFRVEEYPVVLWVEFDSFGEDAR
jgi:chemotaxis protein CheY-P-specific phosphatase CheC